MLTRKRNHIYTSLMKPVKSGFELNSQPVTTHQTNNNNNNQGGRGADREENKGFQAPSKETKTKTKKTKTGQITKIENNSNNNKKEELPFDPITRQINWDLLEKERKRKPCIKLLKKIKKGKDY